MYEVVDNEFNRANYPGEIGKVYASPPAYAAVREVGSSIAEKVEKCSCDCKSLPEFEFYEAMGVASALNKLGIAPSGWGSDEQIEALRVGMNEEREHCDITHGDAVLTAKIALAHLKEDPEYYAKLKKAGL